MKTFSLPPASNRAYYEIYFKFNGENSLPIELDQNDDIVFDVSDGCARLSASLENGKIEIMETGIIKILFSKSEMSRLVPKQYQVGMTFSRDNEEPTQIMIGTIRVVDGIVQA